MLPPTLLELTFFRVTPSTSYTTRSSSATRRVFTSRRIHQVATVPPSLPSSSHLPYSYNSTSGQRHRRTSNGEIRSALRGGSGSTPRSELEKRVKALEDAVISESSALEPPGYTEDQLLSFYEDVLAISPETTHESPGPGDVAKRERLLEDIATINAAERRLLRPLDANADDSSESYISTTTNETSPVISTQSYRRLISHARTLLSQVEAARVSLSVDSSTSQQDIPVTFLSLPELESLGRICVQAEDVEAAESVLNLMKRSGMPPPEDMTTKVMELYGRGGNTAGVESIITTYLTAYPTERQRHFHVKAHLNANPLEAIPTSALEVLHSYESQAHPVAMHTYTSVITSLFSSKSSLGRAQAWDLFTHMRYVAHPDPDVALYTLMIRACASPINTRSSEPEKALDLWTEMTIDRQLSPPAGAYDAVILACARSGSKTYVNEAFRLAKKMLDTHRDARGNSAFSPSRRTFCALLEGAKRLGDLARARWILAEMISNHRRLERTNELEGVNEEIMMHVFHTYASYRPPFQRTAVRSIRGNSTLPDQHDPIADRESYDSKETDVETIPSGSSFTHIPPQSQHEVINEAKTLFDRILYDTGKKTPAGFLDDALPSGKNFRDVDLTPRLLNSYLSVFYKHSSLEVSRDLYRRIFTECEVSRTGRTYVEALERCAIARRGDERPLALEFAEEVWAQWRALEEVGEESGRALSGRTIEKAHIAMIRVLTLTGNIDRALQHVHAFEARYPPSDIATLDGFRPAFRATRTALVGQRPLVRMFSSAEVPDDHVPPLLMFSDVEVLHHRLVVLEARGEIKYLTYLCKAYEWALRGRRDAAMKRKPEKVPAYSSRVALPSPFV